MKSKSTILVIGATGSIGTQVIKGLLADETNQWKIHALTRNPLSDRAKALKQLDPARVRLVQGNTNDISSIKEALESVQGVFCNTDHVSNGLLESQQGKQILEAAKWKNIEYFVYLALDSAREISLNFVKVPHFDAKGEVETAIATKRGSDLWYKRNCTVLTVVPVMENFLDIFKPVYENGKYQFKLPLKDKTFPMIAREDIGWYVAFLFANQASFQGKTLKVAGESLTGQEIAQQYAEVKGVQSEYVDLESLDSEELNKLFKFLREYGVQRDYEYLRTLHPNYVTFKQWVKSSDW